MINVWDYVNAKKIKIYDTEGKEFVGNVVCVMDTEENGEEEDDITIQINADTYIGFLQSEIAKIDILQ